MNEKKSLALRWPRAEPEPAVNGHLQFLRWRFLSKETKQPFGDIEEMSAIVKRNGKLYGPFTAARPRANPVSSQRSTSSPLPGDYEATLTFKKKGDATVHTITFPFKIRDRKDLEIP